MTIHFENTIENAQEFYTCWLRQTRSGRDYLRQVRLKRTVGLMVFALAELWILRFNLPLLGTTAVVLIAGIIGYLTGNIDFKRIARRITAQQKKTGALDSSPGPREIILSPEGFRSASQKEERLRRWSSDLRVEETKNNLCYLFNEGDLCLVPKSAFRDAAHQQEFVGAVERFRDGAGAIVASTGASLAPSSAGAAPWWRNRSAVDVTEEKNVQQRRL